MAKEGVHDHGDEKDDQQKAGPAPGVKPAAHADQGDLQRRLRLERVHGLVLGPVVLKDPPNVWDAPDHDEESQDQTDA